MSDPNPFRPLWRAVEHVPAAGGITSSCGSTDRQSASIARRRQTRLRGWSRVMADAWDTDLGRWALAWLEYRRLEREGRIVRGPDPCAAADAAYADAVALAREVCDDERDADAAVGVMPMPLMVHLDPKGSA